MTVAVRQAKSEEADWIQTSFAKHFNWGKPDGYFASVCELQEQGKAILLIAVDDTEYVGHCKIIWEPHYPNFRDNNIPEIQDLNIRADYRRQGIATKLIDECERRIGERSDKVGIGFGLYVDYGAAQQMYIKRGYVPDGYGVYYHDQPVEPGSMVRVDDDLVLFLVKSL